MRGFFFQPFNSSDDSSSDAEEFLETFLESTTFLTPRRPAPIPTNNIDCVTMSIVLVKNILSIQPKIKHKVPAKHITIPQSAVPEVFPLPLEKASAQENLALLYDINKPFFHIYKLMKEKINI